MGRQKRQRVRKAMKSAARKGYDPYNSTLAFASVYTKQLRDHLRRIT